MKCKLSIQMLVSINLINYDQKWIFKTRIQQGNTFFFHIINTQIHQNMSRSSGEFNFTAPSFQAGTIIPIQTSNSAAPNTSPEIVGYGLHLYGQCVNPECPNPKSPKTSWSLFGLGSYNVAQNIRKTQCPYCRRYLKNVTHYSLFGCSMVAKGLKAEIYHDKDINREQTIVEHSIYLPLTTLMFGIKPQELIQWEYLSLRMHQKMQCPNQHLLSPYKKCYTPWTCYGCSKKFQGFQESKFCFCIQYHLCWDCL